MPLEEFCLVLGSLYGLFLACPKNFSTGIDSSSVDSWWFQRLFTLLGQWLTFETFGDSIFSRENKPFKRLYFRVQDG